MDPILGGQVAAEVRTVEQTRPAAVVPFRYNRARQEIRAACDRLAHVKKEARGKVVLGRCTPTEQESALLSRAQALRLEYRAEGTTDTRREEIAAELRKNRGEYRRLAHRTICAPASVGAALALPALKAEVQAMMWAWTIARAIECDDGLNNSFVIQKIPLANGKWARIKLPNRKQLVDDSQLGSTDLNEFRSWVGDIVVKNEKGDYVSDFNVSIEAIERYLRRWAIAKKE